MIKDFAAKAGKVGKSANSLLSALEASDEINIPIGKG